MAIITEFKKFALRGSVIDMAIGFTVGAAFTTIVRSLVDNIFMPPLGLLLGRADFTEFYWLLKAGENQDPPYTTLAAAQEAGAVTLNYGLFINHLMAFAVVAWAMFLVVRVVNRLYDRLDRQFAGDEIKPEEPDNKKCPFCRNVIHYLATRCPYCTSALEKAPAPLE
ncbi:MAG: large conductance mechanosensitive channel protein MscL [Candidatus Hydrogenedentes bacterium]|nr:large conductance mechanosensitive channel protein MscL [Candidatus Hydrogenedentota bacterium]